MSMGLADFNFKIIDNLKAKVENLNIGLNKDETKINIDSIDQSTQFHYHSSIGLSPDVILKLPSQQLGDYIKQQTILQLQAINPDQLTKLMGTFNVSALTTGTAALVAMSSIPVLTEEPSSLASSESSSSSSSSSAIESITPISSGVFVNKLPKIIDADVKITPFKPNQ